jgi:hypothetical protein
MHKVNAAGELSRATLQVRLNETLAADEKLVDGRRSSLSLWERVGVNRADLLLANSSLSPLRGFGTARLVDRHPWAIAHG